MSQTFTVSEQYSAKPRHFANVVYADNTCIRLKTMEATHCNNALCDFGSILLTLGGGLWITLTPNLFNPFSAIAFIGLCLILLDIILFRYLHGFLVFSRDSGELYYPRRNGNLIRCNWTDCTGKQSDWIGFTGGSYVKAERLLIQGINSFPDSKNTSFDLLLTVHGDTAINLWAYLQQYMENGTQGLPVPSFDTDGQTLKNRIRSINKLMLGMPISLFKGIFELNPDISLFERALYLIGLIISPIVLFAMWPTAIIGAIADATRRPRPLPAEFEQYVTNNPDCWGKPEQDTKA